ncbi:MAG TPA: LamG-like jellyroll fold domain-containing protein [Saprospiraceae bacterium]|nr:LamG-like jellyroll fold domain-containing protein [Saprospiraceae bacterium]
MAYYPFEGDQSDQSGNGNNGIIVGNPILTADRFGSDQCAFYFPGGATNYIKINYSNDFNIDPMGSLSISLWYQGGTENEGDIEVLFEKHNPNVSPYPSDYHIGLYDLNQPGLGSNYLPIVFAVYPPPIHDPNWHHVVGIYDNRKWYFYEDNTFRQLDTSMLYSIFQSTGEILIGKNFEGKIDDIRFYTRTLSLEEIHEIFYLPSSCIPTRTKESANSQFNLYPNPAKDFVRIALADNVHIKDIIVLNTIGKLILSKSNCYSSEIDLNTEKWPIGIYFVQLRTDKRILNTYFVKHE